MNIILLMFITKLKHYNWTATAPLLVKIVKRQVHEPELEPLSIYQAAPGRFAQHQHSEKPSAGVSRVRLALTTFVMDSAPSASSTLWRWDSPDALSQQTFHRTSRSKSKHRQMQPAAAASRSNSNLFTKKTQKVSSSMPRISKLHFIELILSARRSRFVAHQFFIELRRHLAAAISSGMLRTMMRFAISYRNHI